MSARLLFPALAALLAWPLTAAWAQQPGPRHDPGPPPPAAEDDAPPPRPEKGPPGPRRLGDGPGPGPIEINDELWEPLLEVLGSRRPELAERLRALRERDPRRAAHVLADALLLRIEDALDGPRPRLLGPPRGPRPGRPGPPRGPLNEPPPDENEMPAPPAADAAPDGPPGGGPPGPRGPGFGPGPGGRPPRPPLGPGFGPPPTPEVRALQEQQRESDRAVLELAERVRAAAPDSPERDALEAELRSSVEKQFDLRGRLRTAHLEMLREELSRLQRRIDAIGEELERRAVDRDAIIRKRVHELLRPPPG